MTVLRNAQVARIPENSCEIVRQAWPAFRGAAIEGIQDRLLGELYQ
jgi:hypothetical protein